MPRSCVEWNEYGLGRHLTPRELEDRAIDELRDPEWANVRLSEDDERWVRAVVMAAVQRAIIQTEPEFAGKLDGETVVE